MKRTWAFGLCIILLTLIVVGYNVQLQKKIILQEANRNISTLVSSVELELERTFSDLDQTLTKLENFLTPLTKGGKIDQPSVRYFIDNQILENPDITGLSVIDKSGQILNWNNNSQKLNVSQREYFNVHLSGQFKGLYIGLPKQSLINQDQWIFGSSKALHDTDQSLSLVLSAIIDVKHLYRQYHAMFTSPGLRLTITSPAGHVYTSIPGHEEMVGQQLPRSLATHGMQLDNEKALTISRQLTDYPFVVTVTKSKDAVLAPWKSIALSFITLGIGASLIIIFLTYRVSLRQRRQLQEKIRIGNKEIIDPLTNLFNRPHTLELAKLEIKKSSRSEAALSIMLLDLDHFKDINNNYGRQNGNIVLKGTVNILRQYSRETDILCRYGGEEFLLLLPDTDLRGAVSNARKICKCLEGKRYPHTSGDFNVTASFGVAQWSAGEADLTDALKRADAALHAVKNCGRNNVRWMPNRSETNGINDVVCWLNVNGE